MIGNPESTPLVRAATEDLLPSINRWTWLGGAFLITSVLTVVTLVSVMRYNVKVQANATVRPSGDLRVVQAEMEGTVKQLISHDQQSVRQGDVIAYLDDNQLQTKKSQLENSIQQDTLQLAQIAAQIRALESQLAAESNAMARSMASAQAELLRNQRELQDRQRITQADLLEAEAALSLARDERNRYQQLVDSGAISELQLKEKEANVKSAQARRERALASLNPTNASVTMAHEQIAQQQARGESALAALRKEREALIQQSVQIQNQLSKNQKDLQQTQLDIQRSVIRATTDGTLLQLNLRNPGQVVRPGDAIAQIVPRDASLEFKANIATQDIKKVRPGQRVQLRVMACPYPDYGTLEGEVTALSPDRVTTATPSVGTADAGGAAAAANRNFFEATLQPKQLSFGRGNRLCRLQPGMEANADIISKEETVLQFVLRQARLMSDL
jgi:HlyD family secretion protein